MVRASPTFYTNVATEEVDVATLAKSVGEVLTRFATGGRPNSRGPHGLCDRGYGGSTLYASVGMER